MIKVGDKLPAGSLQEFIEVEGEGCSLGPNSFDIEKATAGKTVAIFALPGAFTPTCSAQHVPGYLQHADDFKAAGVDEIWCVAVNDGWVMASWGRDQKALGKIRFLGDGSADLAKKLGVETEIPNMGTRMRRFSLVAKDGVVEQFNLDAPGKFEVSNAETLLTQLG